MQGRIHHCMRAIGVAERVLGMMVERSLKRKAFGRELARHGTVSQSAASTERELRWLKGSIEGSDDA